MSCTYPVYVTIKHIFYILFSILFSNTKNSNRFNINSYLDKYLGMQLFRKSVSCLNSFFPLFKQSVSLLFSSIVADRQKRKMLLGDDGHSWKKKTSDVKENYDFKEILGT